MTVGSLLALLALFMAVVALFLQGLSLTNGALALLAAAVLLGEVNFPART